MNENVHPIPEKIGNYQIERSLGQGGMGEVFLAFDPLCKRHIALKQMRKTLSQNASLQKRFLKEALIAAHLSHPSIIPIYSIHREEKAIFYTMPYVEGETLKQIIKTAQEQEKEGEITHPIGNSIPSLTHVFLKVCQAIAYAHSKGILHRDLKPDNIIVGKYGEVLLFDWGLADMIESKEEGDSQEDPLSSELTKPGKVPGTLLYLAPERILGKHSTPQTDIYALGVILYQILTLHFPFHRKSVEQLRKTLHIERIIDPLEAAPYRDIPDHLADVVKRALRFKPEERFQSVDEIISEINAYLEGRPEWIPTAELDIEKKKDWEFQENVLLAKHMAITRSPDVLQWVSLMISRMSFSGNLRLETHIKIDEAGAGIGFLLALPEASERKSLTEEGYYIWMGSEEEGGLRIFQFNTEVMALPEVVLKKNAWHQLVIELLENHLYVHVDRVVRCHYISHIPMVGTHIGVLYKDADFTVKPLQISLGSQNVMVNCMAIPDAFLANKNYAKALIEYRRIASSFSGRTEGREAIFRAGITLLQQALDQRKEKEKETLYTAAQEEFSTLHFTPGAPLEFLGKSLIYKAMHDIEEEEKCLELALRKYPKHPLLKVIVEQIIFRLHESSNRNRVEAFHFLLLAAGHLPAIFSVEDNAQLFKSLKAHLEPLPFLLPLAPFSSFSEERLFVALQIAFWLAKPITLFEMIETCGSVFITSNAFLCLLVLGSHEWVRANLHRAQEAATLKIVIAADEEGAFRSLEKILYCDRSDYVNFDSARQSQIEAQRSERGRPFPVGKADEEDRFGKVAASQNSHNLSGSSISWPMNPFALHCAHYLIERELMNGESARLIPLFERFTFEKTEDKLKFDVLFIWTYLLDNAWDKAQALLESYPPEVMTDEYSPLYPLMGCYLCQREGPEIALSHFSGSIDVPYPPTSMLLSFYLRGKISEKKGWITTAFLWEKVQFFRQLHLYYSCAGEMRKAKRFLNAMKRELKRVNTSYPYS